MSQDMFIDSDTDGGLLSSPTPLTPSQVTSTHSTLTQDSNNSQVRVDLDDFPGDLQMPDGVFDLFSGSHSI